MQKRPRERGERVHGVETATHKAPPAALWYIAPWRSMTSAIFLPLSPASNFPFLTCTPPGRFGTFLRSCSRISSGGHRSRPAGCSVALEDPVTPTKSSGNRDHASLCLPSEHRTAPSIAFHSANRTTTVFSAMMFRVRRKNIAIVYFRKFRRLFFSGIYQKFFLLNVGVTQSLILKFWMQYFLKYSGDKIE